MAMAEGLRLSIDADAHVATLTIDRPGSKNAFTSAMWTSGAESLRAVAADDSVGVLLFDATGDVFSAGADVKDASSSKDAGRPFHAFLDELCEFPKPVVAAVGGAAVGSGFTMLAYVDIVLASTRARFRAPFVAMGLSPEAGSSVTLPRLLGWQAAAEVMFTAGWFAVDEAHRLGFVREVVEPEALAARARELAAHIGSQPLASLVATKRLMLEGRGSATDARARESVVFRDLLGSRTRLD